MAMKKKNDINILDSHFRKNDSRMSESGRSMVEMQGVRHWDAMD